MATCVVTIVNAAGSLCATSGQDLCRTGRSPSESRYRTFPDQSGQKATNYGAAIAVSAIRSRRPAAGRKSALTMVLNLRSELVGRKRPM